jgi:ferritin-like metal-binding protein YciE
MEAGGLPDGPMNPRPVHRRDRRKPRSRVRPKRNHRVVRLTVSAHGVSTRRGKLCEPQTTVIMAALKSLRDLLVDELRDLHNAENQLLKALPKMAKAAAHEELKEGFEEHLEQTRGHVDRLDRCFKILGENAKGKTCHAMKGLVEEGDEAIQNDAPDAIRDAQLIGAAQRVEHYEIAAYGTARAFAQTLGETKIADLLQETLDEEGDTDKKLTALAETINEEANGGAAEESLKDKVDEKNIAEEESDEDEEDEDEDEDEDDDK